MWNFLAIFGSILVQICDAGTTVYCDDLMGQYTSMSGKFSLKTLEFPIMAPSTSYMTSATENPPPELHPCYSLNDGNNYKNQLYDIFTLGSFAPNVCRRQCAHYLDAYQTDCGDRRPPPVWMTGFTTDKVRKINCSDWNVPLTAKGFKDGISLTYNYATYSIKNGSDLSSPLGLDDKSMKYLDGFFIKGLHIRPIVAYTASASAISGVETQLEELITRHPEIIHVAFGNPTKSTGKVSKTSNPILTPTSNFFDILNKLEGISSLSLASLAIDGSTQIPTKLVSNLKAFSILRLQLDKLPSWMENSGLQFVEILGTINSTTDITVLDDLPNLEHFVLKESDLTTIKSPFLKSSTNLISLTIQCNQITTIEAGAFDHMKNLKFLNLAGNRITSLPDKIFANLNNLLVFDVKAVTTDNLINGYNENTYSCQAGTKISKNIILDSFPTLPNPEKIYALEVDSQTSFFKNDLSILSKFKNLEILNIGNLGLSSISNYSIEKLCNLEDLNLVGNPLDDENCIPENVFINVNLQRLRIGTNAQLKRVSETMVAFMRTASQIMYSIPNTVLRMTFYRSNAGCDADLVSKATTFGATLLNQSCSTFVDQAIENIQKMESLKMETTCGS